MADTERIDKVLWAIRVFKTRTEATDACKGGKVKIGGVNAKPSRMLKVGEIVEIRKGAVQYSYRIKQLTDHRLGAKLVPDYAENLTPQSEIDKLKAPVETFFLRRDSGAAARPRKTAAPWRKPGAGSTTPPTLETSLTTSPPASASPMTTCNVAVLRNWLS